MNYDAMTDRELDALVAEKVMGWKRRKIAGSLAVYGGKGCRGRVETNFRPSESISCAFEVVEAMRERGYGIEIHVTPQGVGVVVNANPGQHDEEGVGECEGESAARCVCIAALRALDA